MKQWERDRHLIATLATSKDIWTLRAATLASMLSPLGIDCEPILSGDKETCLAYLLRSGVTMNIGDAKWDIDDLLDIWRTPITGNAHPRHDEENGD